MRRRRFWQTLLLVLLADGCTEDSTTEPDFASLTVTPSSVTLAGVGAEAILLGAVLNSEGQSLSNRPIEWTSNNPSVVEVHALGTAYPENSARARALGPGSAIITATFWNLTADAFVEVLDVSEFRVSAAADTLRALGDTVRLYVEGLAGNEWIPAHDFIWSYPTDPDIAVVDSAGLVTAVGNGTTVITAFRSGGPSVTAAITVAQEAAEITRGFEQSEVTLEAVGDTVRLSVEGQDSNGHPVANELFGWRSDDEAVAVVDSTGLVLAAGNGSATISATSGTHTERVRVTVAQKIESLRVAPEKDTLRAQGETVRLLAEHTDANGHRVADAVFPITWSSSDPSVASVDGTGLVTAVAEGAVAITARSVGAGLSAVTDVLVWFPSDRDILVALYNATNGPFWNYNGGWLTDAPLDSWDGVETDSNGRVIRLGVGPWYWNINGLRGRIPPELGYLSELRELNLANNSLVGAIPPELGRLANLRSLNLQGNYLTGRIPAQLGDLSQIEELNLSGNQLEAMPSDLRQLGNLKSLNLADNQLIGDIPRFLTDLGQLGTLNLRRNGLTGEIPPTLGNLGNLEVLDLGENPGLTGEIPVELGDLGSLVTLDLTSYACCPQFTGPIPRVLGDLSQLQNLLLGYNRLTGSIPPELGDLANLKRLELHFNQLTGPIPPSLGNLENLELLLLPSNDLSGTIPPELGRLSRLTRLLLWGNSLDGPVPPELGDLVDLTWLLLDSNELTGPLPRAFGRLRQLDFLGLGSNALSGPIPRELIDLPLTRFRWQDSGLCAPVDSEFQAWLHNIPEHTDGSACVVDVLAALYEATGGPGWTNATNWLTGEPVSGWYGVTADDDGRMTELDLRANGLSGALPPIIGLLRDLRQLDLRDNRLTGEIPSELGGLSELRRLYLSDNRFEGRLPGELGELSELTTLHVGKNQFTGALSSALAGLSKLVDFEWIDSGLCAPAVGWYQRWLGTIPTHTRGANCSSALRLAVPAAHVNQAAQDLRGSVPLIAGREGLLRVFATADQANEHRPTARATFFLDRRVVHRAEMTLTSDRGIPEDAVSGDPAQYFRAPVPGEILVPGVELVVEVDPDGVVARAAGSADRFPAAGRLGLDVRELPRMELTIVPVLAVESPDSSVLEWASELGRGHPVIEYVTHVLPVGEHDLNVREPFIRIQDPTDRRSWGHFQDELRLVRMMDGGSGYYFGVIGGGGAGIVGMAGRFVVVGRLLREMDHLMAHELGHAMNLHYHAPCNVLDPDPNFPYRDGSIGIWGYDARSGELVPPSTPDVMSYCSPAWISDYYFQQALSNRLRWDGSTASRTSVAAGADRIPHLLLWGGASPEGELRLNPAFTLDMPAQLPARAGPYRLEGFGAEGSRSFSLDFEMDELSHGGGNFLFAIPFEERWLATLDRLVLTGPEGMVELSGESDELMALVLDRETGSLRSVLRGPNAVGAMTSAAAERSGRGGIGGSDTRVLVSYGLPGRMPH